MTTHYKAINIRTKQMSEQVEILEDGSVEIVWQDGIKEYSPEQVDNTPTVRFPRRPENGIKLVRYTGLKDKHGTMIYEGDIVTAIMDGDLSIHGLIAWEPHQLRYYFFWLAFVRGSNIKQLADLNNLIDSEVIDNIYLWEPWEPQIKKE